MKRFARAARKHWGIENSCHWVLDVTFGEDACRTRDEITAQNLTVSRKLAQALAKRVPDEIVERYSHNKAKYTSIKKRLFLANLHPSFMMEILLSAGQAHELRVCKPKGKSEQGVERRGYKREGTEKGA